MFIAARPRPLGLFSLVLTFFILFAGPCFALTMEARVGFDGVVKGGTWTPVAVRLTNDGTDTFEGSVRVKQGGYGAPTQQCAAKVNLPPHSNKLYHIYAKLPQWGSGVMAVQLFGPRGPVLSKVLTPVLATPEDNLVVSVGPRSSKLHFLNGEPTAKAASAPAPGSYGGPSGKILVGSIAPEDLPDRVAGYDGVDALVLPEFNPSSASPKALKAMSMWVATGGLLILPGGADYRRLQNEFFDELLPVKVTGAGGAPVGSGAAAATLSVIKPGIGTAVKGESFPLIATRAYAAGTVVFLAFDTQVGGFGGWNGQTALWKSITSVDTRKPMLDSSCIPMEEYYQPQPGQQTANLGKVVQQGQGMRAPSFGLLAFFLLAYIVVLVPINYTVLKVKRRLELAWITVPAIALLFTFGAYVIGSSTKGNNLQVNQVRFIEASSDSRYARQITNASIFSPGRRTYCVEAAGAYDLCQVVQSEKDESVPPAYVEDKKCTVDDLGMAMWSNKLLESVGGVDLGGRLEDNIDIKGALVSGSITNNTRIPLRNCSIYFHGTICRVGRLGRGEVSKLDGHLKGHPPQYDEDRNMEESLKDLLIELSGPADAPILVGYSDSEEKAFSLKDERDSGKSITCYAFRLGNDKVFSPPAVAPAATGRELSKSEFRYDTEGWTISLWHSGPYPNGTMAWNRGAGPSDGEIRCKGGGASDNDDPTTREGGEIRNTVSTVGHRGIKVSYSFRVNTLGGNHSGGGANVDHGMIDEQLTVYYSTNGGASWMEAENLPRAKLLSSGFRNYARRTIDLSGDRACDNNPNFVLRFRWQLNDTSDAADLDNIVVSARG